MKHSREKQRNTAIFFGIFLLLHLLLGTLFAFAEEISSQIEANTSLTEENLAEGQISINLNGTEFVDDVLAKDNFLLINAPQGLTVAEAVYDSGEYIVNLDFDGTDFDGDVGNLGLTIKGEELSNGSDLAARNSLSITATNDAESIAISSADDIVEGLEDGAVITVTITGGTFKESLDAGNWTINGLPAGVSIGTIERRADDYHTADITLSGNASEEYSGDIDIAVSCTVDEYDDSTGDSTLASENTLTFSARTDLAGADNYLIMGAFTESVPVVIPTGNYIINTDNQEYQLSSGYSGTITIANNVNAVTIAGYDPDITHTDTIIVLEDGRTDAIELTLKDLNIIAPSNNSGIDFTNAPGENTLYISGINTIEGNALSPWQDADNAAAILVPGGTSLCIDKVSGLTDDWQGQLIATGGRFSAGIGGGFDGTFEKSTGGNITIKGGTIIATGGSEGAGIGGAGYGYGGNITILGGEIIAQGGNLGAGIGGGSNRSGGNISISGGTISATGGNSGAGIGGGIKGSGGTITISGGVVTATGGFYGAGIGGGSNGSGGNVIIDGNPIVLATGNQADHIGKGRNGTDFGNLRDGDGTDLSHFKFSLTEDALLKIEGVGEYSGNTENPIVFFIPISNNPVSYSASKVGYGAVKGTQEIETGTRNYDIILDLQVDNIEPTLSVTPQFLKTGVPIQVTCNDYGIYGTLYLIPHSETTYTDKASLDDLVSKMTAELDTPETTVTFDSTGLDEGSYQIYAVDSAENVSSPSNITLDDTPPGAPSSPDLTEDSDTGIYDYDDLTSDTTPTFTGTAEADITVNLTSDIDGVVGTATAGSDGNWNITASALSEGEHTITAIATDLAGNESASEGLAIIIDISSIVPSKPDMIADTDSGVSNEDNITSDTTPTFTGTAEADITVNLTSDIDGVIGTATASVDGNWNITASALSAGEHTITATATDLAGNESTSEGLAVIIDIFSTVPSKPDMIADTDSGVSDEDNLTSDTTPTFTGTAEANSTVVLTSDIDGEIGTATADVDGNWNITASALSAGEHTITAIATDLAGNESASEGLAVIIDITVPVLGEVNRENITTTSLEYNWVAEESEGIIKYKIFKNDVEHTEVSASTTSYSFSGLTPNTGYTFKIIGIDTAGNQSEPEEISLYTLSHNPENVSAATIASSSITFEITNASDQEEAPEHRLELKLKGAGAEGENKGTSEWGNETTRVISGLSSSTAYELWIQTRNAEGIENEQYLAVETVRTRSSGGTNEQAMTQKNDQILQEALKENTKAIISLAGTENAKAQITPQLVQELAANSKSLVVENQGIAMEFPNQSLLTAELTEALGNASNKLELGAQVVDEAQKQDILQNAQIGESTGLFEIGGRIFDLTAQIVGTLGAATKINSFNEPVAVTIDLSDLELTENEIAKLTGIRYEKDAQGNIVPVKLGGSYVPETKTFTFYTDRFSLYGVLKADKLTKISLNIGSLQSTVNGQQITNDVAPTIINNRTMVPVRFIAENLGADVDWDGNKRRVTIELNYRLLVLFADRAIIGFDTPAAIVHNRILVPLRYIAEMLDSTVHWFPQTQEVYIVR